MPNPSRHTTSAALLAGLMSLAIGAAACSQRTPLGLSGSYLCAGDDECPGDWLCRADAEARKVCVAPTDSNFIPEDGGASSWDVGPLPDVEPPPADATGTTPDATPGCLDESATICMNTSQYLGCGADGRIVVLLCEVGTYCDEGLRFAEEGPCRNAEDMTGRIEVQAAVDDIVGNPDTIRGAGLGATFLRETRPAQGPTFLAGECVLQDHEPLPARGLPIGAGPIYVTKNGSFNVPDVVQLDYDSSQELYVVTVAPDALEAQQCVDCAYNWMPFGQDLDVRMAPGWLTGFFEEKLELPNARLLLAPGFQEAVSREALTVRWNGTGRPDGGDLIEVTIIPSEGGPLVRCWQNEASELTVPASVASGLATGLATVELKVWREHLLEYARAGIITLVGSHRHTVLFELR